MTADLTPAQRYAKSGDCGVTRAERLAKTLLGDDWPQPDEDVTAPVLRAAVYALAHSLADETQRADVLAQALNEANFRTSQLAHRVERLEDTLRIREMTS